MNEWIRGSYCSSNTCVEVLQDDQGDIWVRDSKDPEGTQLMFTKDEWYAFVEGVVAGEFRF